MREPTCQVSQESSCRPEPSCPGVCCTMGSSTQNMARQPKMPSYPTTWSGAVPISFITAQHEIAQSHKTSTSIHPCHEPMSAWVCVVHTSPHRMTYGMSTHRHKPSTMLGLLHAVQLGGACNARCACCWRTFCSKTSCRSHALEMSSIDAVAACKASLYTRTPTIVLDCHLCSLDSLQDRTISQ